MFSLTWAILCAVSSGLLGEVLYRLQEENWNTSKDDRIQWRYQHAQAAVVLNNVATGVTKGRGLWRISLSHIFPYREKILIIYDERK